MGKKGPIALPSQAEREVTLMRNELTTQGSQIMTVARQMRQLMEKKTEATSQPTNDWMTKTEKSLRHFQTNQEQLKKALAEVAEYLHKLPRLARKTKTRPAGPALPMATQEAVVAAPSPPLPTPPTLPPPASGPSAPQLAPPRGGAEGGVVVPMQTVPSSVASPPMPTIAPPAITMDALQQHIEREVQRALSDHEKTRPASEVPAPREKKVGPATSESDDSPDPRLPEKKGRIEYGKTRVLRDDTMRVTKTTAFTTSDSEDARPHRPRGKNIILNHHPGVPPQPSQNRPLPRVHESYAPFQARPEHTANHDTKQHHRRRQPCP